MTTDPAGLDETTSTNGADPVPRSDTDRIATLEQQMTKMASAVAQMVGQLAQVSATLAQLLAQQTNPQAIMDQLMGGGPD